LTSTSGSPAQSGDRRNTDNVNNGSATTVNTGANDGAPALSWDGQTIVFYSNRAGGLGGNDLYFSTRQKLTTP